jgi:hypothetical protein
MATKKNAKDREVGIPGDLYRVEIKGRWYYVVNSKTRVIMAGPFDTRAQAQEVADQRERIAGR